MKFKKTPLKSHEFLGDCKSYKFGPFLVFVANEPTGWHLSISHKSRWPTFSEIKAAKYEFLPDTDMYMSFPPSEEYCNLHPNCFHLWELKKEDSYDK